LRLNGRVILTLIQKIIHAPEFDLMERSIAGILSELRAQLKKEYFDPYFLVLPKKHF